MLKNVRLLILGCFMAVMWSGCASRVEEAEEAAPNSVQTYFRVQRDFVYSPPDWPEELRADLYLPDSQGIRPAVLVVHGGGWSESGRRRQMEFIAKKLARRGYVVLNASYRTTPRWTYPAPVEDLREAVKWLRTNAREYGIDPEQVAVFGYSSGGHLAAQLGVLDGPPEVRVQAVVAGGAPTDLSLHPGGELEMAFLGGTWIEVPDVFREASPVTHVSADDPPFFIYHGTLDRLASPEHAKRLEAALTAAGVRHELHWMKGRANITGLMFDGRAEDRAVDFLDTELRKTPTPINAWWKKR
jgi:acetyl esterase/lipase